MVENKIVNPETQFDWATPIVLPRLTGSLFVSKLDMTNAYNQLELDEKSRKLAKISTYGGTNVTICKRNIFLFESLFFNLPFFRDRTLFLKFFLQQLFSLGFSFFSLILHPKLSLEVI